MAEKEAGKHAIKIDLLVDQDGKLTARPAMGEFEAAPGPATHNYVNVTVPLTVRVELEIRKVIVDSTFVTIYDRATNTKRQHVTRPLPGDAERRSILHDRRRAGVLMIAAQRQCREFSGRNATEPGQRGARKCETHQHFTGYF